ncbi:DUF3034 family protein [Litoribacillus peritrichatus]|uniref:DUF3034 family protein n=1 Tax=Litoribacillus peritrichatus TaxID=718191 RepID=A0ABP7MAE6_9GAMM
MLTAKSLLSGVLAILLGFSSFAVFAGGKFIGTSGATEVEGSGGGGIVPWATITGYGTRDEQSSTAFSSYVNSDDTTLWAAGVAHGYKDRVEVSFARQTFEVKDADTKLSQNVFGVKVRLFGDLVFTPWPQVAVGIQHKRNLNAKDIEPLGVEDTGTDVYLAATKAWLDGPFHRNFVINTTLRYSKANQMGLLGFGGDRSGYDVLFESSVGLYLNRNWIVGFEYRQKPDNLKSVEEDDWRNAFIAFFPSKHLTLVAAFMDLGEVGGLDSQSGGYFSIQGTF